MILQCLNLRGWDIFFRVRGGVRWGGHGAEHGGMKRSTAKFVGIRSNLAEHNGILRNEDGDRGRARFR